MIASDPFAGLVGPSSATAWRRTQTPRDRPDIYQAGNSIDAPSEEPDWEFEEETSVISSHPQRIEMS